MLERIAALEPGIEHAVGIDVIGRGGRAQGAPDREAAVLPEAVDDDRVVLADVFLSQGMARGV